VQYLPITQVALQTLTCAAPVGLALEQLYKKDICTTNAAVG
jgi:hypothetical protein